MSIGKRIKNWRTIRSRAFDEMPTLVSLDARIDAAEYELQSIARDVARVSLSVQNTKVSQLQGQL